MKDDELNRIATGFVAWLQVFDAGFDASLAALSSMIATLADIGADAGQPLDRTAFLQALTKAADDDGDPRARTVVAALRGNTV